MSDCGVCLTGFEGESFEFYEAWTPKARKRHRCEECGRHIEPGQKYHRIKGRWDGEWFDQITCLDCEEIRRAFSCLDTECTNGILWEDIQEYIFPAFTTKCLAKVQTESAREYLRERWMQWKGLLQ